jgi:hypothetical protein
MPQRTEYKLITGNAPPEFQTELRKASNDGWKPILLTSSAVGDNLIIAAILEHPISS